ncbi:MAG: TonB-dependent receptor [Prevotella sp.]|nr:TonB-dependent receptor [Prevotella sp.]
MKQVRFLMLFVAMLFSSLTFAQNRKYSGSVVDEQGEALIGASVVQEGTSQGTVTDLDGNFTVSAAPGTTLVISYVGYDTQRIKVSDDMKVMLHVSAATLSDVVVVGYGVQKKSVVTAAISKVTSDNLNLNEPTRVEDVMKGKVSGVQITQSSGIPGSDSKVRIRGIGTINNSDPLYIVDGMAVDGGISYLNPNDIESIEILKDAASGAIYGARAANGVVLITTKTGKIGKTRLSYDVSYGWQNPWRKKKVLGAQDYMTLMNEMAVNDGGKAVYDVSKWDGTDTDWQEELFNDNAPIQNHQLSLSGGSDRVKYFLSLGYYGQDGIVGGNYDKANYNRWSIRTNSTYTAYETKDRNWLNKVVLGVNIGYSRGKTHGNLDPNSEYGSVLGSAVSMSPLVPVYAADPSAVLAAHPYAVKDTSGNVFALPPGAWQELVNPMAMMNLPSNSVTNEDKFVGTFYAQIDVLPGLTFKTSYGADLAFWGIDGYTYPYYEGTMRDNKISTVTSEMHRGYRWQVENTLSYTKTFNEVHNLSVVLGQSANKYRVRNLWGQDFSLFSTDPSKANINSGTADRSEERVSGGTNGTTFTSFASYFGRVDYNYAERYMVELTLRRDGSSRFGANHKWATFPAFSLGWNLTNEPYMHFPAWISSMKLRGGWGKNGNENIGNFRYTALLDGGQNYYYGGHYDASTQTKGGTMQYGTSPSALPNPDIMWEESNQVDIGFDAIFFNRLNFTFDYYCKRTNGMLMDAPIPDYVGLAAPMSNLGKMKNWGLEFEMGWRDQIGDFHYNIQANATYMRNKLIDLGNESGEAIYETAGASGVGDFIKAKNGDVFPYFYGKDAIGIFQSQAEIDNYKSSDGKVIQPNAKPGDVIFRDIDGNGKIDDGDKHKIGKGMPDWSYGLTLGAEWKGFDFGMFFQGTIGNDIFNFDQRADIPAMNRGSYMMERWHGEGTSNSLPRMTSSDSNGNWSSSSLYIKDGSYCRLKTLTLGYTLPKNITMKFSCEKLRLYMAFENLLTFTSYEGFDPEVATGDYTRIGVDRGCYPQARTFMIGANISF